jgi:hypothetical protein
VCLAMPHHVAQNSITVGPVVHGTGIGSPLMNVSPAVEGGPSSESGGGGGKGGAAAAMRAVRQALSGTPVTRLTYCRALFAHQRARHPADSEHEQNQLRSPGTLSSCRKTFKAQPMLQIVNRMEQL